jgi:hypothetical protein
MLREPGISRTFGVGVTLSLSLFWVLSAGAGYGALLGEDEQYVYEYSNLIPLAEQVGRYVAPGERIYLFPDDEATANLYYLTRTLPPRPWTFTYPWYMMDWMEERILSHLEMAPPDWIVFFPGRWNIEENAPRVMEQIGQAYDRDARLEWEQGEAWLLKRSEEGRSR